MERLIAMLATATAIATASPALAHDGDPGSAETIKTMMVQSTMHGTTQELSQPGAAALREKLTQSAAGGKMHHQHKSRSGCADEDCADCKKEECAECEGGTCHEAARESTCVDCPEQAAKRG